MHPIDYTHRRQDARTQRRTFDPTGRGHSPRGSSVTDQKSSPADERVYAEDKTRVAQTEIDDKDSLIPTRIR